MRVITYGVARAWADFEAQHLFGQSVANPEEWETHDLPWNAIFAAADNSDVVAFHAELRTIVTAVQRWAEESDKLFKIQEPNSDSAYTFARRHISGTRISHLQGFGMNETP